ncbi:hypothetical protein EP10_000625 [Geobacillus icigianus]|uniref:Uncharacterized protein n=1 Tax=Geobacillus icigianus TaxID=1430331 RepID=A0ABU6BD04_9BACL|nr:hypothetical protein [Geobacillus icigianus]
MKVRCRLGRALFLCEGEKGKGISFLLVDEKRTRN